MYIFIVNPTSGNGKAQKVWKKIKKELDRSPIQYRSFFTKYPGHAREIAEQVARLHQDKLESVISVGGDGTLHEVVNGCVAYPDLPVSSIPAGSGNDSARGFRIPKSPRKAVKQLLQSAKKQAPYYDVGHYALHKRRQGKGLFVNGLGIGFDGEVAQLTNESTYKNKLNKFKLGALAYIISVLRLIFRYETKEIAIQINGQKHTFTNVWLVAITNIPYYGGGMKITPKAHPSDGKLNVCIVHDLSPWKLLTIFGTVFIGKHELFKEVIMLEGNEIEVESTEPMTIHADGEIIGNTPVLVSIHHQKRRIR